VSLPFVCVCDLVVSWQDMSGFV